LSAQTLPCHAPTDRGFAALRPYLAIALLGPILAIVGFWASYYGKILTGTVTTPAIIQIHAAVFVGWLLLVVAQAALAATGRMTWHVRVGNFGGVYGAGVVLLGVIALFSAFERHLLAGNQQRASEALFVGVTDMLAFAPFLAASWLTRRRPETHKRLILVATTILLIAPVHRMHWFLGRPAPLAAILAIWLAPIYLGMAWDLATRRLIHPAYLLGVLAIAYLKFLRPLLHDTGAWHAFEAWVRAKY